MQNTPGQAGTSNIPAAFLGHVQLVRRGRNGPFSGLEGREHGEPERDTGSTTTRCLEILSLQRKSVPWVFRKGTWVQDETQPGALGSFSPPLQNKPLIPSCPTFPWQARICWASLHKPSQQGTNSLQCWTDRQSLLIPAFHSWFGSLFLLLVLGFQRKIYLWATSQGIWLIRHPQTHRYLFKSASCYVTWQLLSPCVSAADKYL